MSAAIRDLEASARERLPGPAYSYFSQGSGDGVSAAEAVQAWRRFRFRPHVLRDVSQVSSATALLGMPVRSPFGIAPTTLQRRAHPLGEAEMARGAAAAGSLLCVSSNAGLTFREIADAGAPGPGWWVQVYLQQDRSVTSAMLERAVAAGCAAVVLTVDTPVVASRSGEGPNIWDVTPRDFLHANEDVGNVEHRDVAKARDLLPADIGWLAGLVGLPVVVKGVLRADDARSAVSAGAAAVWVSNHGGRQLDQSIPTACALGAVVASVGADAEVYVDGGLRTGRDALAALALGADAVFVGRPALWALTVNGAGGVASMLGTLVTELEEAMTLCGVSTTTQITGDLLGRHGPDDPGR